MTPKLLAVAALVGTLPLAVPAPEPAPAQAKPQSAFERHWDQLVELGRKRNNGVLMTAKVKEQTADKLVVEWGFDYTGPRQPLIILSPVRPDSKDLYPHTASISIFAVGSDGLYYQEAYSTRERGPYEASWQRPEYFLTIEKGKKATVEWEVPLWDILRRFKDKKKYPSQFNQKPSKLYFRLEHQPVNRGERLDLDAWTGVLLSEPILLELKAWD